MPLYDQVELLARAVLSQGKEEAEKILGQARSQADRRLAAAASQREEVLRRAREEVRGEALLKGQSLTDRAALASKREIAQAKEALLEEIFQEGRMRLLAFRESPDYLHWLGGQLVRAAGELGGGMILLLAHPQEAARLTGDLLAEAGQKAHCQFTLETDQDLPPGGFVALAADGRLRLDLTFDGILERRRESLRGALARLLWGG